MLYTRQCFFLLFATIHFAAGARCPSPCVCSDIEANCTNVHLTEFPDGRFDKDLLEVDFSYNNISSVDTYTIRNWMIISLRHLNISNNAVSVLSERSFIGQSRLEVVDLSSNELEHIPGNTFTHVPRLKWLSLANNKLKIPDNTLFLQNMNLEVLHLENCALYGITLSSFVGFVNLRELYLSYNTIKTVEGGNHTSSRPLTKLRYLELSHNNLTDVPRALTQLPSLEDVNVRYNELRNLSGILLVVRHVKCINISNNPWECSCEECDFDKVCDNSTCKIDLCESSSRPENLVHCVSQNVTSTVNDSSTSEALLAADSPETLQKTTFPFAKLLIFSAGVLVALCVVLSIVCVRELCKLNRTSYRKVELSDPVPVLYCSNIEGSELKLPIKSSNLSSNTSSRRDSVRTI